MQRSRRSRWPESAIGVPAILETYAGRWAIEVCFREIKQQLGFADSSARNSGARSLKFGYAGLEHATIKADDEGLVPLKTLGGVRFAGCEGTP